MAAGVAGKLWEFSTVGFRGFLLVTGQVCDEIFVVLHGNSPSAYGLVD